MRVVLLSSPLILVRVVPLLSRSRLWLLPDILPPVIAPRAGIVRYLPVLILSFIKQELQEPGCLQDLTTSLSKARCYDLMGIY